MRFLFKLLPTNHCLRQFHVRKMSSLSCSKFITDKAYINGDWVSVSDSFDVVNPADGQVIGRAANCDEKLANQAIEAAQEAFKSWELTTAKHRASFLRKMFDIQTKYQKELAELITIEMGKPFSESLGEISYGSSFFEWYAEQAKRINGEILQSPAADRMIMYTREPVGVAGIIVPWNFPNAMITRKLGAALASGCTAVIRPSEDSPFSALAIAKIAEEAGVPPGVINVIPSNREHAPAIGKLFCESPLIGAVSFTGSTAVGKLLLQWGSSTVKRISLELGGNAPFIVFDSADVDKAVEGCIGSKFRNTGQTCICVNRIFVQSGIHDKFVEKLVAAMANKLKTGNVLDTNVTLGPLVNERAAKKVASHVEDALSKGGKLVAGGKPGTGCYYEPTLITGVNDNMKLCAEETFGPLAGVIKFDCEDEVISQANSVRVGLAGYFYSSDISQVWRVARKLQVGMVGVNEVAISCPEAPFGGVKESGLGRESSHMGIEEFTNVKTITMGNIRMQ
ncbi:Succinate-semialdehyde dehydrogenase, mitochondrial [Halotydeus destructor]|nr:Succinate-semialdehyde dehydrogenase, mitochondrial [Halotydeus destructor]